MTSYISLLNKIEAFCNAHLQIKKYKGEFKEQMPNFSTINEKYPIVFIVPTLDSETLELNQFTLDIYCVDIIQKDRANLNTIVSDCHLILKDLYLYFKDGSDLSVDVIADPTMTPLNNFDLDYVAGWVMTITFEVEGYSVCAIPMNPIPPFIPGCEDATYTITDSALTTLYSGSIVSGGDLDQPISDSVAVLKDTAGTVISTTNILAEGSEDIVAPDASYLVEYQNGTDIQSGSIVSGGSVTVTVPNPIVCADATVEVNGVLFDTVASGDTLYIEVRQEQGSTLVGSKQGQYWRVDDSPVSINGTLIADVPAEDSLSIAVELDGTPSGTWNSGTQTWEVTGVQTLYWELNYNGTDDVIFIPATSTNAGTLTSGSGSNVGTITVSTDGVTYGALSFPFTPVATTTYYFKRSTATVTGAYAMTGTYV